MKYETFYKAKDIIEDVSNLGFAKEQADCYKNILIGDKSLYIIFERIYWHDKNMYKAIMQNISERLEARLFELNIELEAI